MPVCTGKELTDALLKQIEPFGAHLPPRPGSDRGAASRTTAASSSRPPRAPSFLTKTIFIAAGVGAFQPRTLKVDGLEKFDGSQLFYRVQNPADFAGKNLVIVGGGDSALDWALNFAAEGPNKAESVILVHRRDGFKAAPANVAKMKELCDAYEMQFIVGQVTGYRREGRQAHRRQGHRRRRRDPRGAAGRAAGVLRPVARSSARSPTGAWQIERKQLVVDTEKFSTSVPGIFAVGDINTYPGKKKLILSGFHECALAAFGAVPFIFPDKKVHLQYTTTSPKLHKVLGVESPVFD